MAFRQDSVRMDTEAVLKQDSQLCQKESFLERAVQHLGPQHTLVYKKENLQILCFLDEGMKSNIIFH